MDAPVTYIPNFVESFGVTNTDLPWSSTAVFERLWNELDWVFATNARREYWMNEIGAAYTYGEGRGQRTYQAQPWHDDVRVIMQAINHSEIGFAKGDESLFVDCCFVNGYEDKSQSLDWHADDSPEMDHARPIAVVSLGAEREIYFRPKGEKGTETLQKQLLGHGSLLLMHPGMQLAWNHKIPKAGYDCGPRLSLTYRGLLADKVAV